MEKARGLTLSEVARLVEGRLIGDPARVVRRIAPLVEAGEEDLSILTRARYHADLERSRAGAVLVREGHEVQGRDVIVVQDPHRALVTILPLLHPERAPAPGVSAD